MGSMVIALICDVFYDFLSTEVNNSVGILEMVIQSDRLGMPDRETLRSKANIK